MNTLAEFDAWLTKAQNLSFVEEREKLEKLYTQYTKAGDTSEADYRDVTGGKPGPAAFTPEGAKFYQDRYTPGNELTVKFKTYTIGVITPWQLLEDMRNNGRVKKDKFRAFQSMNQDLLGSLNKAREIISADFLVRADSTTVTNSWQGVGRDSLALASASHVTLVSGDTWSSIQTGSALTPLTLKEAITKLENQPDENGHPQGGIKRIGIMCGRYYEWRLPEILKSAQQPDSDSNNVNSLKHRGIEYVPIVNPWVGASEKGWMVIDLDNNPLMRFDKDEPFFGKAIDPFTDNRINKGTMRYAIAFVSAKGVVFNSGPS